MQKNIEKQGVTKKNKQRNAFHFDQNSRTAEQETQQEG